MLDESNLNLEKSRMIDSEGNIELENYFKKNKSYKEAFEEEMNYGKMEENSRTFKLEIYPLNLSDDVTEYNKDNIMQNFVPERDSDNEDTLKETTEILLNPSETKSKIINNNNKFKEHNCTISNISSIERKTYTSKIGTCEKKFIETFLKKKRKFNKNNSYEISESKIFKINKI